MQQVGTNAEDRRENTFCSRVWSDIGVCVCIVSVLDGVRSESAGAKNWTAWSFPSCLRRNPGVQRVCWRTESKKRQNWLPVNGLWNFFHFKLILLLHNISFWIPFNIGLQNLKKKCIMCFFIYTLSYIHLEKITKYCCYTQWEKYTDLNKVNRNYCPLAHPF